MTDVRGKISALIDKATHMNTPVEEARSCALAACRLIKKHGIIGKEIENEVDPYMSYSQYPIAVDDIEPYRAVIAYDDGRCVACGKKYIMHSIIAESTRTKERTHFACKRFFVE